MDNVPCANTFYLNQYMKQLDAEAKWDDMVEKTMEVARVCVIREKCIATGSLLYSVVLVSTKETSSPIVYPQNDSAILAQSSEEYDNIKHTLLNGQEVLKTWAEEECLADRE